MALACFIHKMKEEVFVNYIIEVRENHKSPEAVIKRIRVEKHYYHNEGP